MSFSGKNILITGGLGFIGSTLARRLVDEGARVTIVDSLIPEYGGNQFNIEGIRDRLEVNISDVRDPHSIRSLVAGRDVLFNLAGQTSHWDSMVDPFTDLDINARAQLSILEAARDRNPGIRIVYAGTRQVYGRPRTKAVDEDHPLAPVDVNGVNKLAGEWFHTLYNDVHGIRSVNLRLTNVIGPRMRIKDARQTFLGIWIRRVLEGAPFEVWGGDQIRDLLDVEDAVDAFLLAAESTAEERIFNVGSSLGVTLKELAETLVRVNGGGSYIVKEFPPERRRIDIGDYTTDASKIERVLGWKPKIPLEKTLERTLAFYRENIQRYA